MSQTRSSRRSTVLFSDTAYHSSSSLILFTLISFPFLYFSLELPKTIINKAIGGKQFPQHLFGFDFNQVTYLLILCGLFLILVFVNGGFKYYINTFKGRLGERMLRRLRYQLYHRMLRFPLSQFSKTSSAQIIPMITSECESLGGFIGDAFVTPVFQGGTLTDDHCFHVHAGPGARRRGSCTLSGAGLCDPETATQGQSARETPCPHGARSGRPGSRVGGWHCRHPCQRCGETAADSLRPSSGDDLRHTIRDLPTQVFRKVSQ